MQLLYQLLSWKVQHVLMKAKPEPYLGFLHSTAKGKPSLICDFQELFVIQYSEKLDKKDLVIRSEDFSAKRKGRREFLNDAETYSLIKDLNQHFQKVGVSGVRIGRQQEIETLISEEALLFAKYLRDERQTWVPRVPSLA